MSTNVVGGVLMDDDVNEQKPRSLAERIYGLELRYMMLDKRVTGMEGKMNWLLGLVFSTLVAIMVELVRNFGSK